MILRTGFELAVQRIVIARRIGLVTGGLVRRRRMVFRFGRRLRRGVAEQRMHRARIILLRRFLPAGALHPRRRARSDAVIVDREFVLIGLGGARLHGLIGPAHAGERIGLTDQPRELSQRIALDPRRRMLFTAAIVVIVRGKRSILISISHGDDASPSGKLPTPPLQANQPLPDALTDPHVRAFAPSTASRPEHGRRERRAQMPEPRRRPEPKPVALLLSLHHY